MEYDLNGTVKFNCESRKLTNTNTNKIIELPIATSRLLHEFIQARNCKVGREFLLDKVWEQHGLVASGSNLNRNISLLRKAFQELDMVDVIETIPKHGYIFKCECEHISKNKKELFRPFFCALSTKKFFFASVLIPVLILSVTLLAKKNESEIIKHTKIARCDIYADKKTIKSNNINVFFSGEFGQKIKNLCKKKSKIVYYDDNKVALNNKSYSVHIGVCGKYNKGQENECENYVFVSNI